eukprot:GHVN01059162.1.p1 GENE.GHVN01059162.1~~GHVN01059162.1.p1  ORF type:complete len:1045 (-),score=196.90 GHVN01059162.1:2333-5467(-)
MAGIDFAMTSRGFFYHTARDTPSRIEQGLIQRYGDNILGYVIAMLQPNNGINSTADTSNTISRIRHFIIPQVIRDFVTVHLLPPLRRLRAVLGERSEVLGERLRRGRQIKMAEGEVNVLNVVLSEARHVVNHLEAAGVWILDSLLFGGSDGAMTLIGFFVIIVPGWVTPITHVFTLALWFAVILVESKSDIDVSLTKRLVFGLTVSPAMWVSYVIVAGGLAYLIDETFSLMGFSMYWYGSTQLLIFVYSSVGVMLCAVFSGVMTYLFDGSSYQPSPGSKSSPQKGKVPENKNTGTSKSSLRASSSLSDTGLESIQYHQAMGGWQIINLIFVLGRARLAFPFILVVIFSLSSRLMALIILRLRFILSDSSSSPSLTRLLFNRLPVSRKAVSTSTESPSESSPTSLTSPSSTSQAWRWILTSASVVGVIPAAYFVVAMLATGGEYLIALGGTFGTILKVLPVLMSLALPLGISPMLASSHFFTYSRRPGGSGWIGIGPSLSIIIILVAVVVGVNQSNPASVDDLTQAITSLGQQIYEGMANSFTPANPQRMQVLHLGLTKRRAVDIRRSAMKEIEIGEDADGRPIVIPVSFMEVIHSRSAVQIKCNEVKCLESVARAVTELSEVRGDTQDKSLDEPHREGKKDLLLTDFFINYSKAFGAKLPPPSVEVEQDTNHSNRYRYPSKCADGYCGLQQMTCVGDKVTQRRCVEDFPVIFFPMPVFGGKINFIPVDNPPFRHQDGSIKDIYSLPSTGLVVNKVEDLNLLFAYFRDKAESPHPANNVEDPDLSVDVGLAHLFTTSEYETAPWDTNPRSPIRQERQHMGTGSPSGTPLRWDPYDIVQLKTNRVMRHNVTSPRGFDATRPPTRMIWTSEDRSEVDGQNVVRYHIAVKGSNWMGFAIYMPVERRPALSWSVSPKIPKLNPKCNCYLVFATSGYGGGLVKLWIDVPYRLKDSSDAKIRVITSSYHVDISTPPLTPFVDQQAQKGIHDCAIPNVKMGVGDYQFFTSDDTRPENKDRLNEPLNLLNLPDWVSPVVLAVEMTDWGMSPLR